MNVLTRFSSLFDVCDDSTRVAPPMPGARAAGFGVGPARSTKPFGFADFNEDKQRNLLRDHLRKVPSDGDLLGEAINSHRLAGSIKEAFLVGDKAQLGFLVDRAMREYLGDEYVRVREGGGT